MSVVAIHPRTHSAATPPRAGAPRAGSTRRRPPSPATAPVLRVTVDVPLVGERFTPELARLLELVRDLLDRGEDLVAVTTVPAGATGPMSTRPAGADRDSRGEEGAGQPEAIDPDRSPDEPGTTQGDQGDAGLGRAGARHDPSDAGPDQDDAGRSDAGFIDVGWAGGDSSGVGSAGWPGDGGEPSTSGPILRVLTGPRVVLRDGAPVPFTRLEFDLLVFLARHPRRVFTRLQLLTNVWGYEHAVARTVDVHVRRLRAKVGDRIPLVTTVHGVGYRLADDAPVRVVNAD